MKKLPENFSLEKYGLKVRLVNENDADFILSLRANPNRTKHMVTLNYNIENQKKWIQEYKKREEVGLDYYFIFKNSLENPIGVSRFSHIDINEKTAKASSWIAVEGLKYEPLKMVLISNEIIFNLTKVNMTWGEVHNNNSSVIKIFKLFGYEFKDIGTEYNIFSLKKNDFEKACENNIINRIKTSK